jgi:hypothetical protein
MTKKRSRPAAAVGELGPAGARVKAWLLDQDPEGFDSTEPLCLELARLADSLAEVRGALRRPGLTVLEITRLRGLEQKLSQCFCRAWRLLGLADPDTPGRGPGRPSSYDSEGY